MSSGLGTLKRLAWVAGVQLRQAGSHMRGGQEVNTRYTLYRPLCSAKLLHGFKQENAAILLIFFKRSLATGWRMGQYKAPEIQGRTRHSIPQSTCSYRGNEIWICFKMLQGKK